MVTGRHCIFVILHTEVIKPLHSLRLSNASGSQVAPDDPFIMAILSRQKIFGVAILNMMGEKQEQYTDNDIYNSNLALVVVN